MSEGALLINGVHLGDPARSLQHPVALPEVPPPHVLVGDLYDVSHGEPALLSIRQADTLVHALVEGGGAKGRSEVLSVMQDLCWHQQNGRMQF